MASCIGSRRAGCCATRSRRWSMPMLTAIIALCGTVVLAGCYGSKQQARDGQSHWLKRCASSSECSEGQFCACGVCTIECEADGACGENGTCAVLDDIAACSAPGSV